MMNRVLSRYETFIANENNNKKVCGMLKEEYDYLKNEYLTYLYNNRTRIKTI